MDLWMIRASLFGMALTVLVVGLYAVHRAPAPAAKFTRQVHWDHKNKQGDMDFLCETQYCNDGDKFVGLQTHLWYKNGGSMLAGVPAGKAVFGTPEKIKAIELASSKGKK